jgi:BirA family transcriptional regulator, biotin operon repressor / biotin---[acetyl-CoA-carboxylase] ligase
MSLRDNLLERLAAEPRRSISGAVLAREFGVTRTSVWKHFRQLRAAGLPVSGSAQTGYRIQGPIDLSLVRHFSMKPDDTIHYDFQVDSTQRLAKDAAATNAPDGHCWVAEVQTAGRGRLDRAWSSPYGGLWFSLVKRPALAPSQVPPMALVASVALAECVERLTGLRVGVKWPNDLLLQHQGRWKKCAGILTEMTGEADRVAWVVIGVGMNVFNQIPLPLRHCAVSLTSVAKRMPSRYVLLRTFLDTFHAVISTFERSGFELFRHQYWKRYFAPDTKVRLKTAQGHVDGIARGVDAYGALLVESRRKISPIFEGEITL